MLEKLEAWLALITEVQAKMGDGQIKKAIRKAREQEDFPDEDDVLVNISARWNTNERKRLEGLITEADFKVENNIVTKLFLTFLAEKRIEIQEAISSAATPGEHTEPPHGINLPSFEGKVVIVINYAQEDQAFWNDLKKHFFMFFRDKELQFVDIHEDVPLGVTDTFKYQEQLISIADRVLSLVSPNLMAYPTFLFAEQALAEAKLIPIRIEKVELEDTPFNLSIRGLPADNRFVSEWADKNGALADIAKHLRPVIKKLKADIASK